ncbi:hypothetical protein LCM08_06275 [Salipiger pacificus]|nr:hypothetical protein [Alloyangia pacifica]
MTEDRGTGRTKRQLEEAVKLAQAGQRVVYVWPVGRSIGYPMNLAAAIAAPDKMEGGRRAMRYGSGEILFRSASSEPSGLEAFAGKVIFDHAARDFMRDRVFANWNRIARGAARRAGLPA